MTISDGKGGIQTCDFRWWEETPGGTKVSVICGEPLQNIGEFNGICPYWNKHTQGSNLPTEHLDTTPTVTSKAQGNPILKDLIEEYTQTIKQSKTISEIDANYIEFLDKLTAFIEDVIGSNEPEFNTPKPELENMIRNRLMERQRARLKGTS